MSDPGGEVGTVQEEIEQEEEEENEGGERGPLALVTVTQLVSEPGPMQHRSLAHIEKKSQPESHSQQQVKSSLWQ